MTDYARFYTETVTTLFRQIEGESAAIQKAAGIMRDVVIQDKLIHVIGTGGHANIGTCEFFWRTGGLVPINGILDPGTLLSMGALRSNRVERTPGYAATVLDAFDVHDGALIIINAYGMNAMTIDAAVEGKRRGIPTIGITSRSFADTVPPSHPARHPSGQSLYSLVDVFVDCHLPYGDAVVEFEGIAQKVGAVSTLVLSFAINLLVIETARLLKERGVEPPLWASANLPGGDERNREHVRRYKGRIRLL
jgi:uncharacterized phosphosugar-binding protein